MNEIHLTGLSARHPAAAMAAFGLYELIEGIAWKKQGGSYYPVLYTAKLKDIDDLTNILCDRENWRNLLWRENPSDVSKNISCEKYHEMPEKWTALATDHIIQDVEDKKVEREKGEKITWVTVTTSTPFAMFIRNIDWGRIVEKWLEKPSKKKPDPLSPAIVKNILTNHPWKIDDYADGDQRNGLFYEVSPSEVNADFAGKVIPVVCLMACLSYRFLPCFAHRRRVTALGWKNNCFYYPIFERRTIRNAFLSWMINKDHLLRMPPEAKKAAGLLAVYCSKLVSYKMAKQKENVLWEGVAVK